jgi:hypothetical protein
MITVITPPTTNDLTIAATATRELGLATAPAGLAELIAQASAICALHCNRPEGFGAATVRQTERLTCSQHVLVLERDVNPAITGVSVDGVALAGTDYERDGALLYRLSGNFRIAWPAGVVVVDYTAGYVNLTDLPHDIEAACLLVIAQIHGRRGRDPMLRSEAAEGVGSVSYLDPRTGSEAMPPQAAALLAPYRRVVV